MVYSIAFNPIRDTVFCGNEYVYTIWGVTSETLASALTVLSSLHKAPENLDNSSVNRPTWRQSEIDVAKDFPDYLQQKSFLNGEEVQYGTKGSVRPDLYKEGCSIDVKNYNVENLSGRNNLARNIEKQYYQRLENLPDGTKQAVLIDIRGQNVSVEDLSSLYNDIMSKTKNGISIKFKTN